ncbi:hypothetical protein [Paenibacillus maysiensis]|uniref:hypothetical protein n=1 Tax=Paenibacillus maysiensis TaxID=1155954 RepID=UPI00046F9F85|nr:hypothetical protein [Paenibacillus maysiensis]
MKVNIEYGENIIVAVILNNEWTWYVTEKEYWYLDLIKLENAYLDKGYKLPDQGDYSDRFDIAVLDEKSAYKFLYEISELKVSKVELSELVLKLEYTNSEDKNFLTGLTPSLLVDFDNKLLMSYFPEPASFENYTPDGWSGVYENFIVKVPMQERYWVIDGKDYFHY